MEEYFKILKEKLDKVLADIKIKPIYNKIANFFARAYNKSYNFLNRAGTYLGKKGVSANMVSWIGFAIGMLAVNFLAMEKYGLALFCILLNRFCDGLDGAIARSTKITDFGVFLDATLDYIFYGGIILGFALANPVENSASACYLYFGFVAAACAMLAYSVIAFKNNSKQQLNLDHSPFYLGGAVQGSETLVSLVLLCLFPGWFKVIAIILGSFSLVKAFSVIVAAYYNFVIVPYGKNKSDK